MEMKEQEIQNLLTWYDQYKRDLPWRQDQEFYHVWLSEIMLQQTRVEAVKEYYTRFLKELPTIDALANVDDEKLMKLWEGLGYYSRARNLKKCAKQIQELGKIPNSYVELLKLAGIGPYTAAAIASICYQEKVPAIDGNVFRVMMRFLGSDLDITLPKTRQYLWQELLKSMPDQAGNFNQSLMELGATVCVPNGKPLCESCPLSQSCIAKKENRISELPRKAAKKERRIEKHTILLIVDYNEVALIKRPKKGLLASLYGFPSISGHVSKKEVLSFIEAHDLEALRILELPSKKHIFTHIEWHMIGYLIFVPNKSSAYIWTDYHHLKAEYALPTAYLNYEKELCETIQKYSK